MTPPAGERTATGYALAMVAATGLGLAIALARYAYDGGTTALTIAGLRAWLLVAVLAVICVVGGRSLRLSPAGWLNCLGLGILLAHMYYGNVGAVRYIPVGLAALLFFTYPPQVSALQALIDRRWPPLAVLAALVLSFTGLLMMLGASLGQADWRGVALALTAGAACAWNAVWVQRRMAARDQLVMILHMSLVAAVVLSVIALLTSDIALPTGSIGWFGLLSVAGLQAASLPLYFLAIPMIGAERSAIVTNIQPVVSIGAAYLLFGETLSGWQLLGGAMVLGGVFLQQAAGRRTL